MTDHKFTDEIKHTDEEIVTFLESAAKVADCNDKDCAYKDGCDGCLEYICKEALSLINRQKAEIEALKLINSTYEAKTEEIREIAIKEFSDKMLHKVVCNHKTFVQVADVVCYLKQLTEETTGS